MEGLGMVTKDEPLRSRLAIRCAKAVLLLSSLRSFRNSTVTIGTDDGEVMLQREIASMRIRLAREKMRSKRIKLCGLMELILVVMLVLLLSTFALMFALKSP